MRISKIALFLVLPIVVLAALIFFLSRRSNPVEYKLADGSIVRLEKVTYGKEEKFMLQGGWLQRLRDAAVAYLPNKWANRFAGPFRSNGKWWNNSVVHTNSDAIHIWVTRRDPLSGNYLDVKINSAQLVDEHGCTFIATQCGGDNNGLLTNGYCVGWFTFEAFPRHERNFRLQLFVNYGNNNVCVFKLANPAPPPKEASDWVVKPLPITNQDGDVTFVLNAVNFKTNFAGSEPSRYGGLRQIAPVFEATEPLQPTQEWQAVDIDLWDSSGNFASEMWGDWRYLCPKESAWKLAVRFFGSEKSASASNGVWTLRGLEVPGSGEFTNLNATNELQGVAMTVIALAGPGRVTYLNNVPAQASPMEDSKEDNSYNNSYSGATSTYKLAANTPHVAVLIGRLSVDQRLTIRATDDRGRVFYAREWAWGRYERHSVKEGELHYLQFYYDAYNKTPNFFILDLQDDSKTVDLTFCIHKARTTEFIFKPPSDGAQPTVGKQP